MIKRWRAGTKGKKQAGEKGSKNERRMENIDKKSNEKKAGKERRKKERKTQSR